MLNRSYRPLIVLAFVGMLSACSNTNVAGTYPKGGALIPNTKLHLTPGTTIALEKLVYWGGVAAIAYYVTDPLAPNWEIREAKFPDEHYRLSLRMKRYYSGGAGESRVVFNRRADELVREGGYERYEIVDYSEGMESSVLGAQRVSEGTIVLVHAQGTAVPARKTASSRENPRS